MRVGIPIFCKSIWYFFSAPFPSISGLRDTVRFNAANNYALLPISDFSYVYGRLLLQQVELGSALSRHSFVVNERDDGLSTNVF